MIKELHTKLQNGDITSVELVKRYLDVIKEKDGALDAFLGVREEKAMAEAELVDAKIKRGEEIGMLAGIPYGVKDIFNMAGEEVTCASKMLEGYKAPYDATVIARLKEENAIAIGRTNMDEFAMGASTETSAYKKTKHPLDVTRVPGGSSGGSASAVASGMVPWALGTDTGGSIRQPASFCGIVGLKPTYGRASRYGIIPMASSCDQAGPLTTSVEDSAIVLSAIAGEDKMDATSAQSPAKDYTKFLTGEMSGVRIGVPREYVNMDGVDAGVRARFEESIEKFKALGADVVDIELPYAKYALPVYYIIVPSEVSSNMARFDGVRFGLSVEGENVTDGYFKTRAEGLGAEVKRRIMLGTYALSAGYYDAYYKKAQKVRALIRKDFETAYKSVDFVYTPTSPETAFPIGSKTEDPLKMYLSDIFTVTANMAGVPAISFPIGTANDGGIDLPVGGQLMGKWFDEEGLLRVADAYERS
jgi:aspartyl-tRNA(Asn)/glutamyl-tRNA(Gln) amidotransferase subunit A